MPVLRIVNMADAEARPLLIGVEVERQPCHPTASHVSVVPRQAIGWRTRQATSPARMTSSARRSVLGLAVLLAAVVGLVGAWGSPRQHSYIVHVAFSDGSVLNGTSTEVGNLDVGTGELDIGLPELPSSGLVKEAFIADRTRAQGDAPILSFPGPQPLNVNATLSSDQVSRMRAGDYALLIRTAGSPPGRITGQAVRSSPLGGEETEYDVRWYGEPGDSPDYHARFEAAGLPREAEFRLDPAAHRLCLVVDYTKNRRRSDPVAASLSVPGHAPAIALRLDHDATGAFWGRGCLQAGKALEDALDAGRVQVTVDTAAAPALEFVGTLSLERFRSRWIPGK